MEAIGILLGEIDFLVFVFGFFTGLALGLGAIIILVSQGVFKRSKAEQKLREIETQQEINDRDLSETHTKLAMSDQKVEDLRTQLSEETSRRITAETRSERIPSLEEALTTSQNNLAEMRAAKERLSAQLEKMKESEAEKMKLLEEAQIKLSDAFNAISGEALRRNNKAFLELAQETLSRFQENAKGDLAKRERAIKELIKPVEDSLSKMDSQIGNMEKDRVGAYEGLKKTVQALQEGQSKLHDETNRLVRALSNPTTRGRWGEIQLKRVVEMAGMSAHCDFSEQPNVGDKEKIRKPDMIVHLPGTKNIVIDAKTPLDGYLQSVQAETDKARTDGLRRHARHIRDHIKALGGKAYWEQFGDESPEFVVLFLPGENFFSAALEEDPGLIEFGMDHSVVLATPTTLIALLRAVAYGWRQEALTQNAKEISVLGTELYGRLAHLGNHMDRLGDRLGQAVKSYNSAVGTLESRVLVSARRFRDLEARSDDHNNPLPNLTPLDAQTRSLQADELVALPSEEDFEDLEDFADDDEPEAVNS